MERQLFADQFDQHSTTASTSQSKWSFRQARAEKLAKKSAQVNWRANWLENVEKEGHRSI